MSSSPAQAATGKSVPAHVPGRGRVYDSIADAIGDTPLVRLNKLPQQRGAKATILAKLEYFNPGRKREGPHRLGDDRRDGEGRASSIRTPC